MPKKKKTRSAKVAKESFQGVRPIWSGTITFGLVSIPVDLLSTVRPRQTAMKLIDKEGHPIGRQYQCSKEGIPLTNDDLVRGYETEDRKMVVITDKEFESLAPEMSADIRLRNFVPLRQIPALYFQRSYFLAPSGKSASAYNLLAATMNRTGRAGIGSFVMRGHEYLVAIVSDHGILRADTLRYADEIRSPDSLGLPEPVKLPSRLVGTFTREIEDLKRNSLDPGELEDEESGQLQELVKAKKRNTDNVIHQTALESEDEEESGQSAQVIDLTEILRRSLSRRVVVKNVTANEPISLDERRISRKSSREKSTATNSTRTRKKRQKA